MATSSTSVPSKFKCALIQLYSKPLDIEANFAAAEQHIREAAAQGADLAVLPEFHLTGVADDPKFAVLADKADEYLQKYQALAKGLKINIVPGSLLAPGPPRRADDGSSKPGLLNIASFISSSGEVLGSYTKVNLWIPERPHILSGPQAQKSAPPTSSPDPLHSVFDTPLGRVGMLICWDLAFPEAFRSLILQGAQIIIIPSFWLLSDMSKEGRQYNPESEALFVKSALVSRAFENTCCIIFVNAGGPKEEGWAGISRVTLPIVGTLPGAFEDSTPGLKIVDIDTSLCDVAESAYKIRQDLAHEDWHYGYEKPPVPQQSSLSGERVRAGGRGLEYLRSALPESKRSAASKRYCHSDDVKPPPKNWKEVVNNPYEDEFKAAIRTELKSLRSKHAHLGRGFIVRFKARLVIRGDLQDISNDEVRAITAEHSTLRILCALIATFDLDVIQADAVNAFVSAFIDEEIYLTPPQGRNGVNEASELSDTSVTLMEDDTLGKLQDHFEV
ncbi:hypothetical protein DV738_g2358, partial [Chaetothyriales sp. CBS 135597]